MDSMSGMSSDSSSSSSSGMSMAFTDGKGTPLYSNGWVPTSTGAYAGTCIFLVILAIISRCLVAWRQNLEQRWHQRQMTRRFIVVADSSGQERFRDRANGGKESDSEESRAASTQSAALNSAPWRLSTDLPRSLIFTVQAGVGYLMMLAVMTLNVGYFLSVLAGLFVGELVLGRYTRGASYGVH